MKRNMLIVASRGVKRYIENVAVSSNILGGTGDE